MKSQSIASIACGLVLAATHFQAVQAQTAAPAKEPRIVSRDELRVCMNSEAELAKTRKALDERIAKNRDDNAAIRADSAALAEEGRRLEEEQKSMDRFNRKVKAHNVRIDDSRKMADTLKADLEGLNKGLVGYNEKCGGISFLPEDKQAILKERESAPK
jgi:predicted RNase H-like nuclease (RuvC/YqgF family)